MQPSRRIPVWVIALGAFAIILIACVCVVGSAGLWSLNALDNTSMAESYNDPALPPTNTPHIIRPTKPANPPQPLETPESPIPVEDVQEDLVSGDTLEALENALVPINDPLDLAKRLEGKGDLPRKLESPIALHQTGDQQSFWVMDTNTNQHFQVEATLGYVTEHVYFWVADDVKYKDRHLKALVETFEQEIYGTNRSFFGSEWTPGVDADVHLYILYTQGLGGSVAGYFSPGDEYLPVVREYSNGHEMFVLSAEHVQLDDEYAYGVLAHEFQHMIHWFRDRNEESWVNEGFSELAMLLNNYETSGASYAYISDPDIQLTDWPTEPANRTSHYGASFMFMTYFLDRFGEDATKALVADPENGLTSIDKVLAELNATDPLTGKGISADDVFADWVIASYLQDPDIAQGQYTYNNYPDAPQSSNTEEINDCPVEFSPKDVSQYGVDYISITCEGDYSLHFEGSIQVNALPADPYSGSYAFYSNRGDTSDMTLTKKFDFTDQSGPLTLTYCTWYDLEEDYDYLHLAASLDGETWQILTTPSGTPEDPSGNSYGWAYNGLSGGDPKWLQESVDISQFAGKEVQLRFEYITDAAVNGEGLLVDDIAVPETGYFTDFEDGNGGWEANGFVRIQNILPQTYLLTIIRKGREITVEKIEIAADNSADIPIHIGDDIREVVLVISGATRFTRQKAAYQFSIQP